MLSILIPTYNYQITKLVRELHLQAIASSIDFEIIVQDDCSTKFTLENKSISNLSNVQYVQNNKNLGRSATRMLLAKKAKYNTILFLDADVIPMNTNFIQKYIAHIDKLVVCGGYTYKGVSPLHHELLRYKYGSDREEKQSFEGVVKSDFFLAGNCMFKKELFLKVNTRLDNFYGDDLLVSQNLKRINISISLIYNPVHHYGLESSNRFLEKSLEAISSIVDMENKGELAKDFTKLQSKYVKLKRLGVIFLCTPFLKLFKNKMYQNLISESPSLLYFDLYRLLYYITLKKE